MHPDGAGAGKDARTSDGVGRSNEDRTAPRCRLFMTPLSPKVLSQHDSRAETTPGGVYVARNRFAAWSRHRETTLGDINVAHN